MRDVAPDTCTKMFDMSIQEVNGKGPKKRKKSLERICDNEERQERSELNAGDGAAESGKNGAVDSKPGAQGAKGTAGPGGVELLHWRDMPQHLQFNPYVLTGYRPLQGWAGCVGSLFYFHNETINILTHGVSLVYILAVLPGLLPWGGGGGAWFLSLCHLLGALAPWCGSFLYHLFMNHTRGEHLYHRLLQLDMLGIWVSQSIGAIPMVTATVHCAPAPLRYSVLAVYSLGSMLGLYKVNPALVITFIGDARVVAVGAAAVLRGAVLHARAAGRRARGPARRRLPARHPARVPAGRGLARWRRDRRHAHPREVVPGRRGPLPQLAQHHARAGGARRVLHAPGDDARPGVDVARGLPRAAAHALTAPPPARPALCPTPRLFTIRLLRDSSPATRQLETV